MSEQMIPMLVSAVAAGAAAAAGEVAGAAIVDAYQGLRALLVRKFGAQADVAEAIEKVEARPGSDARRGMLAEELAAAGAAGDAEAAAAAQKLLELLQAKGIAAGDSYQAAVYGSGAVAQDHSVAAGAGGVAVGGNVQGDVTTGGRYTAFDQRGQQVQNQTNVAGDQKKE